MKRSTDERSMRRRLLDGETLYGLVIKVPSPALVEMCAAAGLSESNQIFTGRRERIRTSGPCLPKAVLYQAELLSELVLRSFSEGERTSPCEAFLRSKESP